MAQSHKHVKKEKSISFRIMYLIIFSKHTLLMWTPYIYNILIKKKNVFHLKLICVEFVVDDKIPVFT